MLHHLSRPVHMWIWFHLQRKEEDCVSIMSLFLGGAISPLRGCCHVLVGHHPTLRSEEALTQQARPAPHSFKNDSSLLSFLPQTIRWGACRNASRGQVVTPCTMYAIMLDSP